MAEASPFFHVESPRTVRNLKERLQNRHNELMMWFLRASDWDSVNLIKGRLEGISDALNILEELEQRERN